MQLSTEVYLFCVPGTTLQDLLAGKELATSRQVAIKKIKVGQFKDGLDMSAIREVKYLREVHHPNVIEVSRYLLSYCRLSQLVDETLLSPFLLTTHSY